jgi:hypothetical protein
LDLFSSSFLGVDFACDAVVRAALEFLGLVAVVRADSFFDLGFHHFLTRFVRVWKDCLLFFCFSFSCLF